MELERKELSHEIEDIDEKGVVSIYVNAFGNTDADGDISAPGSFKKTIVENFKRIKHFANHDTYNRFPIGLPLELKETEFGLLARSAMNLEKEYVRDIYSDYKFFKENDRTLEHSIGFKVISRDQKMKSIITEYKLWEYSTLGNWGANQNTPLVDIKNLKTAEDIILKFKELVSMYNLAYSDGRLKQIEQALQTLETMEPEIKESTTLQVEPFEAIDVIQKLRKSFQEN